MCGVGMCVCLCVGVHVRPEEGYEILFCFTLLISLRNGLSLTSGVRLAARKLQQPSCLQALSDFIWVLEIWSMTFNTYMNTEIFL